MKKEYKKPKIFIEDFNICQNIASGCEKTEGAQQYQGGCKFIDEDFGKVYFNQTLSCGVWLDQKDCQDGPNMYAGYFFS